MSGLTPEQEAALASQRWQREFDLLADREAWISANARKPLLQRLAGMFRFHRARDV